MAALILNEIVKLVDDWSAKGGQFDGIIYMMFILRPDDGIIPLHIGKAETFGSLFDKGLISFQDDGTVLVSSKLHNKTLERLGAKACYQRWRFFHVSSEVSSLPS